jgi:peptidoglycan/xylan/chitin deacetylase (PgdA/CDA1 family)
MSSPAPSRPAFIAPSAAPVPVSIPILMYHQIDTPPARGAKFRALTVAPASFARQMRWLKFLGYQGLSMRDLEPYLKGEKRGKVVGITFDDGYQNNLTHALPVLQRMGFSATCYVLSQKQSNDWDAGYGVASKALMTPADMRQWLAAGQDIGSHTRHHVRLPECDAATAQTEITQSKHELEAMTGAAVRHFCYPYGQFDASHERMAAEAGYVSAATVDRGRARPVHDSLLRLPRVPVWRATSSLSFLLKIATAYEDKRRA